MPLREVRNRSLSDQVFDQLSTEIMNGTYAFGTSLPAERTLAMVFKVNRHVVREALKRLEQVGLVRIAQGGGTRVLDPWAHAGLDLLALIAERPRSVDDTKQLWLSVLEMRACIAVDVVRLCALRASLNVRQAVLAIAHEMREAADDQSLYALEIRFWERVHEGSRNLVYRLAFNSMIKAAMSLGTQAQIWSVREVRRSDYHVPVAEAIMAGDAVMAEARTRETMQAGVDEFRSLLGAPVAVASGGG